MAYSGTFNFTTTTNADLIIRDAYQRCGKSPSIISGEDTQSALLSLNLILQHWANKGLILPTDEKRMLQLYRGQPTYILPIGTIATPDVTLLNVSRQLGGQAASSAGGNATNAFDGNSSTACTQTTPNGNISYAWGSTSPAIYFVGIQSNENTDYSIIIEYSYDGAYWNTALDTYSNLYLAGYPLWWAINAPLNVPYMRIREYAGATLNIQEIYFSIPALQNITLEPISRDTWMAVSNKTQQAVAGSYYLNKTIDPNITFYPTPDNTYTNCFYTRKRAIYDVTQLQQNVDLKQTYIKAAVSALAADLSIKMAPEKFEVLDAIATREFDKASQEDVQDVPISIQPNMFSAFGG